MPGQLLNPPAEIDDEEENYVSSEDEDFNPEKTDARPKASSSSEADSEDDSKQITVAKPKRRPKQKPDTEAEDLGFENSGDEGIIKAGAKEARKRKRKRKDTDGDAEVRDSGGEGGFVQTRSMRAAADPTTQKRSLPTSSAGAVTADIDALWARLSSSSIVPSSTSTLHPPAPSAASNATPAPPPGSLPPDQDLIPIQRTYTFAGTLHTETKLVPRSSAQAAAYLATKDTRKGAALQASALPLSSSSAAAASASASEEKDGKEEAQAQPHAPAQKRSPTGQVLFRPLRRYSAWDPNPGATIRGLRGGLPSGVGAGSGFGAATTTATAAAGEKAGVDARLLFRRIDKAHLGRDAGLCWPFALSSSVPEAGGDGEGEGEGEGGPADREGEGARGGAGKREMRAQRLNVVEKSKLDWAEHVDSQEGAREELEKARRGKADYLARREFLDRVGSVREEEARVRRLGGKGA